MFIWKMYGRLDIQFNNAVIVWYYAKILSLPAYIFPSALQDIFAYYLTLTTLLYNCKLCMCKHLSKLLYGQQVRGLAVFSDYSILYLIWYMYMKLIWTSPQWWKVCMEGSSVLLLNFTKSSVFWKPLRSSTLNNVLLAYKAFCHDFASGSFCDKLLQKSSLKPLSQLEPNFIIIIHVLIVYFQICMQCSGWATIMAVVVINRT